MTASFELSRVRRKLHLRRSRLPRCAFVALKTPHTLAHMQPSCDSRGPRLHSINAKVHTARGLAHDCLSLRLRRSSSSAPASAQRLVKRVTNLGLRSLPGVSFNLRQIVFHRRRQHRTEPRASDTPATHRDRSVAQRERLEIVANTSCLASARCECGVCMRALGSSLRRNRVPRVVGRHRARCGRSHRTVAHSPAADRQQPHSRLGGSGLIVMQQSCINSEGTISRQDAAR